MVETNTSQITPPASAPQRQEYSIFLEQMRLQDSPESQEMYTRMMRGMSDSPKQPLNGRSDVSAGSPVLPEVASRPATPPTPSALGATSAADIPPTADTATAVPPLVIDSVIVTPEVIDDFRLNFDNPGEAFARDLVATFQGDFSRQIEQDPNFLTYEGLRNGTAGILNFLPSTRNVTNSRQRAQTDDQIAILFSNAEAAPFARPFLTEMAKTAPVTYAGVKTIGAVGSRSIPAAAGNPYAVAGAAALSVVAGLGAAGLVYMAGDEIEERMLGPDIVVTPNQRALYESYRTLGGFMGGAFAPWLYSSSVNLSGQRLLQNIAADAPVPLATRMVTGLEKIIGNIGRTAREAPVLTATAEMTAAGGAALGAYQAEKMYPGQTAPRLVGELLGANTLAATVLRILPRIVTSDAPDVVGGVVNNRQRALFDNINKLYADYGTPEQYDTLIANLTGEDITRQLQDAFPGVNFTAAQRGGDPLIMAIEATKAQGSQPLDAARKKAETASYQFMNNFIQGLVSEGSDASLRQAAVLRQSVFDDILRTNLQLRVDKLLKANEQLQAQPGQTAYRTQEELSEELYNIVRASIDASKARERDLWSQVGNINVIEPLGPNAAPEDLPAFLQAWESISFRDPALQREFLKAAPVVNDFINTARRDLGLTPAPQYSEPDVDNIARYRAQVENAIARLSGFAGEADMDRIVKEASVLPFSEQAAFYRAQSETALSGGGRNVTTSARRLAAALDKMGDLTSVQAAAQNRATAAAGDAADDTVPLDAQRLAEVRSRMLDLARGFAANPETGDFGRRIGILAEAISDDLDKSGFGEAYDVARAYTRARHDVFSRTIIGPSAAKTPAGGRRLPPEVFFQTYINSNPGLTLARVRQLQDMAEWADTQGLKNYMNEAAAGGEPIFTTVDNTVNSYLRGLREVASRDVFDPRTGQTRTVINAQALDDWKSKNKNLLEAFPQLQFDLADAASTQRTLDMFRVTEKRGNAIARQQSYLSQLIGGTSPIVAVGEAFNAENPVRAFNNFFALRRMGADSIRTQRMRANRTAAIKDSELTTDEVNQGLRTAVLEYAYMQAGGEGAFNPQVFYRTLYGTLPNTPRTSLMDIAERYDVFDDSLRNRIRFMSEQMVRMQAADAAGKLNDPDFAATAGPIVDFYVGILGSAAGTKTFTAVGASGPGSISAANVGARELRKLLSVMPQTKRLELIDTVFTDPALTASLMTRPQSAAGIERQYQRIIRLLGERGFVAATSVQPGIVRETFEEEDRGTGAPYMGFPGLPENRSDVERQLRDRLNQQNLRNAPPNMPPPDQRGSLTPPPPAPTGGGAAATAPIQRAAAPQAPPQPPSGPVDRARFAAFFPNDPTTDLIRQQAASGGIGSLMGG